MAFLSKQVRRQLLFCILLTCSSFTSPSWALTCQQVRQLTAVYLKMHYSFNNFDDELSSRTLDSFIKSWDPGKLYFYAADIQDFKTKYEKKMDDMILSANCEAITDITNVYGKRFEERTKYISTLIDQNHNFKIDEYMELDRKKLEYAKTTEEINERWRQRIKFQLLQLNTALKDLKKSREKLHKRFDLQVKRQKEQTTDEIFDRFLNAFSSSLDPHSEYMSADSLEEFRIQTRLSLEGIGAVLRSEDGFTVIQSLVPGGAAAKGEKTGNTVLVDDKIIAVAQGDGEPVDVIDMDLREVVKLIRGPDKTIVKLTLVREEGTKTSQRVVAIKREKVQLTDKTAKSKIFKVQVDAGEKAPNFLNVGVLNLPSFYIDFEGQHNKLKDYRSSARDMQVEIEKLKKQNIDSMVLDLRNNGGGSLTESIQVAGLFFDKGPVVQIKDSEGNIDPQADTDGKTYFDGPLVVLISRQSASASEIFAGAIQDYERGLIVGDDHTFGKGTVQNLNDIGAKLGATKVTISKFYRPSGSTTQLNGVASDIAFPSIMDVLEIGEKHYDYALQWDKIKATPFSAFNSVKPYVKTLQDLSKSRVSSDEGFKSILKEIDEFKKNEAKRTRVSLNENDEANKSEEEKNKAKDKNGKGKKKSANSDDEEINIAEDYHLQESIRIATDYVQLLHKKKTGKITIPGLQAVNVADTKKDQPKAKTEKNKK